jgi:ubiquinol-cytochrome c reductase cytochrome b subunit
MRSLLAWLDDRTGYKALIHEALYERVPGGARWRYVWGSTLVFAFSVQCVTGLFLWMAYSPSAQTAWESVYYIQYGMQFGWLLRGLHHFTAQAMVVLLALHLLQVVIDGAYKAPREVNFWLGLILMQIVLGLSLTGYLLPWDQKGYWATKVATNIAGITPVIGTQVQELAVGGQNYGHHTLTRFFALHAGLLPALLIGFLVLHIYVFRRHGITVADPIHRPDTTFWPDQVLKDAIACLTVLAVVLVLALWNGAGPQGGAELGAPADPAEPYDAARPEWYFLFLFQFLKYFPGDPESLLARLLHRLPGEPELYGAMVVPGMVMGFLFLMPFIGRWKLGHRFNIAFLLGLFLGIGVLTWRAVDDDQADASYQWAVADAEHKASRVKFLVEEQGIAPAGAVHLLHNDPKTAGASLFARKCASCHRYDGHNGVGKNLSEPATASDLGTFGTRDWSRGILTDIRGDRHFGATKFVDGEMSKWVSENVTSKKATTAEIDAVIEFLQSLSERKREAPADPEKVTQGQEFFALGSDAVSGTCYDCHSMKIADDPRELFKEPSSQVAEGAPDLTGYVSAEWLRAFLTNPGDDRFYGGHNAMPAFGDRLTPRELDLLVRWLLHDWPEFENPAQP